MNHYQATQFTLIIICGLLVGCTFNENGIHKTELSGIEHGVVYYQEGRYAAWPANNGVWYWDNDEILVGFEESEHDPEAPGLHKMSKKAKCGKYARSLDGGKTWTIEDAYTAGQSTMGQSFMESEPITNLPQPIANFADSGFVMTFRRAGNHNGFSHFYYSMDRGHSWSGPYNYPTFGLPGVVTRTNYEITDGQTLSAFLTVSKSNKMEGRVAYARTEDGGISWDLVSMIGEEHAGFDIMPSTVRISPNELVAAIRTRTKEKQDMITSYYSDDNGQTWQKLKDPVADTGRGGSPPALLRLNDNRLALAYAYRSENGSRMNIRFSNNNGISWGDEIMIRGGDGANRDAGYPVLIQRQDGKLVMIYYWNHALSTPPAPHRYIAYSIIDPHFWN